MTQLTRLNKYISETGFCSRREADKLIEAGRVKVNGNLPEMGVKVSDQDEIQIDNTPLKAKPKRVYIAYNKPVGVTCTTERKIQSNIVSAINYPERIFPIGRLDRPSEGLIFLTNEGDIVNKILRAGNNHEKEYLVTVDRPINKRFIERMAGGIPILDTVTKKCFVKQTSNNTFTIILTQGLNRQIRRMCEYLGYEVTKLKRVRIMNVNLNGLRSGQWRHLTDAEMKQINDSIAGSAKTEEGSVDPNKKEAKTPTHKPATDKKRFSDTNSKPRFDSKKPNSESKRKPGTLSIKKR
ncbi:Dual-specificity RNA pseudouridine synthase RluF [Pseudoalteromonas holothuriae]|uniref:Pseudouridine synthase n=1 Tax=Pseudoalteromonas holothuriae TaxID=2963714 RepID=A0A9W4R1C6_9GAMM|nr:MULTISPECIES: 23S rRNA pseudouridine(2604) synthase RluF [unclassified Pseudoalteromonas]CAH9062322.1 Dual-specificity RNA pseudouridine synthase RluF [Pseudoalteromonas sp. CIP111854]CAH9066979.1 Dual-specificity RNA pseudouridine synthase RluF [Pseudoalteromonas sp. CIP111951]